MICYAAMPTMRWSSRRRRKSTPRSWWTPCRPQLAIAPRLQHPMSVLILLALIRVGVAFGGLIGTPVPPLHRVRRTDSANLTQWLACASGANEELHRFCKPTRKSWREPALTQRCCFPAHGRCFRAVLDGHIGIGFADSTNQQYAQQIQRILESPRFGLSDIAVSTSRRKAYTVSDTKTEDFRHGNWSQLHADYYENQEYVFTAILYLGDEESDAVSLVGGETGIADAFVSAHAHDETNAGTPSKVGGLIHTQPNSTDATAKTDTAAAVAVASTNSTTSSSTSVSSAAAATTTAAESSTTAAATAAIAFTAAAAATASAATLTAGLVVEPRRGRLLLFSGGGENYHAPLAVVRGRRTTLHVWFRCACEPSAYQYGA